MNRLAAGNALYAPGHLDAEVVSALRHLAGFPIRRTPLAPLLDRIWELRANVTAYDAAYLALAEQLDAPIITCDAKLTTATGIRCPFELIT